MTTQTRCVSESDIRFDTASTIDPFGKVFWFEESVYRTVEPASVGAANSILKHSKKWNQAGMVPTEKSSLQLDTHSFVLSHKRVEFTSYCSEWTPSMLRDAALVHLRLQLSTLEDGFMLADAHPWNILFDHGNPLHVDVGSIRQFDEQWFDWCCEEFRIYFFLPLVLFKHWGVEKTYSFLNQQIPNRDLRLTLADEIGLPTLKRQWWQSPQRYIKRLISRVKKLDLPAGNLTEWSNYDQKEPDINKPELFADKLKPAYRTMKQFAPCRVADIGCNTGWFSLLAESLSCDVVAADIDIPSVDILRSRVIDGDHRITPVRFDICDPTPANGKDGAYPSFIDRAKSEVVLLMAVVHHVSYKRKLSFADLAQRIADLTLKAAVVEFIPAHDEHVARWDQTGMEWYTKENFVLEFMKHFSKTEEFPSTPQPRSVFVFYK